MNVKYILLGVFFVLVILMDGRKVIETEGDVLWVVMFGLQVCVATAWALLLYFGRQQQKVDDAFRAVVIETKKLVDVYDRERAALHAYIAELHEKEMADANNE